MTRTLKIFATAAALTLSLVACSGSPSTPDPETAPPGLGKVSTIEQLRDAFIDAGGVCNWAQDDGVVDSTASGTCSSTTVLSIYTTTEKRDAVVDRVTSLNGMIDQASTLLVGENWIINSPEAESMQETLGGEWFE